jgi:hypothetical protein
MEKTKRPFYGVCKKCLSVIRNPQGKCYECELDEIAFGGGEYTEGGEYDTM